MELFASQFEALTEKNVKGRFRGFSIIIYELGMPATIWSLVFLLHALSVYINITDRFYPKTEVDDQELNLRLVICYTPTCPALTKMFQVAYGRHLVKTAFFGFASLQAARDYGKLKNNTDPIVIFDNDSCASESVPKNLKYKVLINHTMEDEQTFGFAFDYTTAGVSRAQLYVAQVFVNYWQNERRYKMTKLRLSTARLPVPKRLANVIRLLTIEAMSFFDIFLILSCFACKSIVEERELKLKESMALMGMTMYVYWLAWFLLNFLLACVIIVGTVVVISVPLVGKGSAFIASPLLLIIFMMALTVNILFFSLFISCFIKKARHATPILYVLNYGCKMISDYVFKTTDGTTMTYLAGIFVYSFGYTTALTKLKNNEKGDVVSTFSNINDKDLRGGSILDGIICMSLNALLCLVLTWYVDEVYKGDYGVARPFYFCLTASYWIPSETLAEDIPDIPTQDPRYFETPNKSWTPGIQVRDLVKTFGNNTAVAGVNIDIYNDQITVLLGHNGAGKTTTISMITGFIPPTSGTAIVNGYDINENISKVRGNIGLCPQHDILFPKLTVFEHLVFYCKLRGQYSNRVNKQLHDILDQVGLAAKKSSYPGQLSGGQRRKLSVACAFSGDSKVIFLDEPSTGLDPSARQDLWRFFKLKREGRTILMTTHYMDEADAIGDRIAIMAKGVVQCYGTSWFLKNVYGIGYKLTIVKGDACNVSGTTVKVLKMAPTSQFLDETQAEIEYRIPDEKVNNLPKLLRYLEDYRTTLGVSSYGLKATTLEDVFIRVGEEVGKEVGKEVRRQMGKTIEIKKKSVNLEVDSVDGQSSVYTTIKDAEGMAMTEFKEVEKDVNGDDIEFNEMVTFTKNRSAALFFQQLSAIIIKKWILFKRTYVTSAMLLLLPCLCVLGGTYFDKTGSGEENKPSQFSLAGFPETITLVRKDPEVPENLLRSYTSQFRPPHHVHILPNTTNDTVGFAMMEYAKSDKAYDYDNKVYIGAEFLPDEVIGYYGPTVIHAEGITVQMLINAYARYELGYDYSVQTGLKYNVSKDVREIPSSAKSTVFLNLIFTILPAVFIHRLITERAIGAKHLQMLSGVNPFAYWLGNFFFDISIVTFIEMTMMIALLEQPFVYLAEDRWIVLLTIFLMYAGAMLPFIYCTQLLFKRPANGVTAVVLSNFIFGFILAPILTQTASLSKGVAYANAAFSIVFPNYALCSSIQQLAFMAQGGLKRGGYFGPHEGDDFRIDHNLLFHLAQLISFWMILYCIEFGVLRLMWYLKCGPFFCLSLILEDKAAGMSTVEEGDVVQERERIRRTPLSALFNTDSIIMLNLKKQYLHGLCEKLTAVKSTCLGIAPNECFGLLGQNGAGKTTTFKMLTGDVVITSGDIYVESKNIKWYLKSIQSRMGYCPQYDALHDLLTGEETLFLYGRLRGVPEKELPVVTARVVTFVNLSPHETKLTRGYSGGTKRKLSLGISLIGNPAFIMLDEPTAGMDPISRRTVWEVLNLIRKTGRTLILTSHSMEECDALCTRIAIMGKGQIMCLGSPQYLKNKYGQGFTVIIYAAVDDEGQVIALDDTIQFIINTFPDTEVFNQMDSYVHLQVPETERSLADVFETLQDAQDRFKFARYTVQQTSLEQVFLMFMKKTQGV